VVASLLLWFVYAAVLATQLTTESLDEKYSGMISAVLISHLAWGGLHWLG